MKFKGLRPLGNPLSMTCNRESERRPESLADIAQHIEFRRECEGRSSSHLVLSF